MTSKGQITVPALVRKALGLKTGDRLDFKLENGHVEMTKVAGTLDDFVNVLLKASQRRSIKEMNEAIADAASERRD